MFLLTANIDFSTIVPDSPVQSQQSVNISVLLHPEQIFCVPFSNYMQKQSSGGIL